MKYINKYSFYNYDFNNPYNQYQNNNMMPFVHQSSRQMPNKFTGKNIIPLGMTRTNNSKIFQTFGF